MAVPRPRDENRRLLASAVIVQIDDFRMDESAPHLAQLRELKRRRNQFIALWFGVGASVFVLIVLQHVHKADGFFVGASLGVFPNNAFGRVFLYVFTLLGMGAVLASYLRISRFPCPRCSNAFMTSGKRLNPWTRKCLHCGLSALDSL